MKEKIEKLEELAKDWLEFANVTDGIKTFKKDNLKISCYDEEKFKVATFVDFQGNDIKLLFHKNSPAEINGFTIKNITEIDKIIQKYNEFLKEEVEKQEGSEVSKEKVKKQKRESKAWLYADLCSSFFWGRP